MAERERERLRERGLREQGKGRRASLPPSFVSFRFVQFLLLWVVDAASRSSLGRLGEWVASALIVNAAAAAVSPLQRSDRGQHN